MRCIGTAHITLLLQRNVTDAENVTNALRCNVTAFFKMKKMMKDHSVRDAVREILENVQASGRPLPSIRALRTKIGKGSLGTISEAVNDWKQEKLV